VRGFSFERGSVITHWGAGMTDNGLEEDINIIQSRSAVWIPVHHTTNDQNALMRELIFTYGLPISGQCEDFASAYIDEAKNARYCELLKRDIRNSIDTY
jgi:hypothetical protein